AMLAQVLELVPDVQPRLARDLILRHFTAGQNQVLEAVIQSLFEPTSGQKVQKRRPTEKDLLEGDQHKKPRLTELDYSRIDRNKKGGAVYRGLCLEHLLVDFPDVPKNHIKKTLFAHGVLYAPTHLCLCDEKRRGLPFNYIPVQPINTSSLKGKGRALEDAEFEREHAWLLEKLKDEDVKLDETTAEQLDRQGSIECGCCFGTYPFDEMVQCPDAHLFCSGYVKSYAETLLSVHNSNINCIDQSGCNLAFPVSILQKVLPDNLLELYERVRQRNEIEMAGLEGLEECPFCDFKCIIEGAHGSLFCCGNIKACGAITCRQCKKKDHRPKSCKEMEGEQLLECHHVIEEAMSKSLSVLNCPRCDKGGESSSSCNKMTCPFCRTMSCYVCRKEVTSYEHFNVCPESSAATQKCPLWEPLEHRHTQEVNAAAEKAMNDYRRVNPGVQIKLQLAKKPRIPVGSADPLGYGLPGMPRNNPYV
ncbi:hypothetical protein F5051DRAFT_335588, partial [Lentinula edodes]